MLVVISQLGDLTGSSSEFSNKAANASIKPGKFACLDFLNLGVAASDTRPHLIQSSSDLGFCA
jgi:hypothetical protein